MDDHHIFAGEALSVVEASRLQPIRDKRFYMACLDLEGRDCLVGGAGPDVFVLKKGDGNDVVQDFNAAEGDRIFIDDHVTYAITQSGGDTVITLAGGDTMVLAGINAATFNTAWIAVA